jgi:hypothetical protein
VTVRPHSGLVSQVTIESLPDDVLLETFHFYRVITTDTDTHDKFGDDINTWEWRKLVQVCRRWRHVIFASPLSLDLQLLCTRRTRVRELLDIWPTTPTLPLVLDVEYFYPFGGASYWDKRMDNLIAALERPERIRQIRLFCLSTSQFEQVAVMTRERSFPALTHLSFGKYEGEKVIVLDPFLNGSAPRLQHLYLWRVAIPSLPNLLLSATDLTTLRLCDIPVTSYISPETMVACLSALTKLDQLDLLFQSRTPRLDSQPPFPDTRTVLPALTKFSFQGVCQYLEILLVQLDAPLLKEFKASYFDQLEFDIPQAIRFICYRGLPMSNYLGLTFCHKSEVMIALCQHGKGGRRIDDHSFCLEWTILCKELDGQVFSVLDVCSQIVPLFSTVERLDIWYGAWSLVRTHVGRQLDDVDPTVCLDLFRSLTSVKRLDLSTELEPFIAAALEEVPDELVTEVFPALETIYMARESLLSPGLKSFVAARQQAGRPVVVEEE